MNDCASLESQLGVLPCTVQDTEEMFWLRQSDDYASRKKLGDLLARQYRFAEAAEAYSEAERIRPDDDALYLCLGGALLTLGRFGEARDAYERAAALGQESAVRYPMGVWHYLQGEYAAAASCFSGCLPCGDELAIAVLYWHGLSCLRAGETDLLLSSYDSRMQVGHHGAYQAVVELLCGQRTPEMLWQQARQGSALDAVILLYGLAIWLERQGERRQSMACLDELLEQRTVWPCISYLAAWWDRKVRMFPCGTD